MGGKVGGKNTSRRRGFLGQSASLDLLLGARLLPLQKAMSTLAN